MRRLALLALVVPLLAACGGSRAGTGATTYGPLEPEIVHQVPTWIVREHLPPAAVPGAHLFAIAGCTACHTYMHSGTSMLGGPDLTAIGRRHLGIAFEIAHLKCPSCVNPGSPMPPFDALGRERLRRLAIFLEASKGTD